MISLFKIAFIDSGVGGLSVLEAVKASFPNSQLIYFADQQHAPYGDKTADWLIDRTLALANFLNNEHQPDCIIIACNTASTLSLQPLRQHISTPIVGVVPAIKPAAEQSPTGRIGILATPATINGKYIQSLIHEYADHCLVTKVASTELVLMAEAKLAGYPINMSQLQTIIQPIIQNHCDHVVLGCTHFPLLKDELTTLCPDIQFVDSAQAIAKRCNALLKQRTDTLDTCINQNIFYSSQTVSPHLFHHLRKLEFHDVVKDFKLPILSE